MTSEQTSSANRSVHSSMMLRFVLHTWLLLSATLAFAPVQRTARSSALNVAVDTSDIKNGLTVELDGEPYKVLSFSIMKQARGAAKTTIKFKNLMKGNTLENTYRSGEKFETAQIDKEDHIFSYSDENNFYFMNAETFDEVPVDAKIVEDMADLIDEGMQVSLVFFKGNVIECNLAKACVYTVTDCPPNTNEGKDKPLTLSSGAVISGPGYIEIGEAVKVDTEKRVFLSRDK